MTCDQYLEAIRLAAGTSVKWDFVFLILLLIITLRAYHWAKTSEYTGEGKVLVWGAFVVMVCISFGCSVGTAYDIQLTKHPIQHSSAVHYCAESPPLILKGHDGI